MAAVERFNSQPPGRVELLAGDSQHQQVAPVPVDELMAAYRAGAADAAHALPLPSGEVEK